MNLLTNYLTEDFLIESESGRKTVVVYGGRFQPFHKGHFAVYNHLVKKFGKDSVYIATSDKTDNIKSPFGFKEKKLIMSKLFGVPINKIVQVKTPYQPVEILNKYDEKNTSLIVAVGEKDSDRLGGKYFKPYSPSTSLEGYKDKGYVYMIPPQEGGISASQIRASLTSGSESDKKKAFASAYPKFDEKIFKLIVLTLNKLKKESINEVEVKSISTSLGVDRKDMPQIKSANVPDFIEFLKSNGVSVNASSIPVRNAKMTQSNINLDKVKTLMGAEKDSLAKPVIVSSDNYILDGHHRVVALYNLDKSYKLKTIKVSIPIRKLLDLSAKYPKVFYKNIDEDIKLKVNKGDTILTGKFKNKKTKVTDIGKDEHDMPTINGRVATTFRYSKEDIDEMAAIQVTQVANFADKELSPADVVLGIKDTDHFFQRLNDPRNGAEITQSDLIGFFKRLSANKPKFLEFMKKYQEFVVSDKKTSLNIPFIQRANKLIAKTIMRKKDFKTNDPILSTENVLVESSDLKLNIPSDIDQIHKAFKKAGKKLYVVGGAVRDAILGNKPKDFDLATDAKPDEVLKIAKDSGFKTAEVGKAFGVVIINGNEIATFRRDLGKGRRPDAVDYTDIEGDVKRRDLTVNALFYDIDRGEIVDLVGGIKDLKNNKIRTVGDADERFGEDALRKLRALRFQTKLGGTMDPKLLASLKRDPSLHGVSPERIRDEFIKSIKSSKNSKQYMDLVDELKFSNLILPNLKLHTPYTNTNDYIVFLSHLLQDNNYKELAKKLNSLTYTNDEVKDIIFLVSLKDFTPEKVANYKKNQSITSLSDDQIIQYGKLIGKDLNKFTKFELSVKGGDAPSNLSGKAVGDWIDSAEKKKYLNEDLIKQVQYSISPIDRRMLLQCGGSYGHMNHPFDIEMNLTFGDLKNIVKKALTGKLQLTTEKVDGQAIAVSWKDGRLVAARNKSHLKNAGKDAMDFQSVVTKFLGRGTVSDAFTFAMKDLELAISGLSDTNKKKIFKNGKCFMNCEIVYPQNTNVIPYGQSVLLFHGTMEYDAEGNVIGANQDSAKQLASMITKVNANIQNNFSIQGPPVQSLPVNKDLKSKQTVYIQKIQKLQSEFGLTDKDGVASYHQAWWRNFVNENAPDLDEQHKIGLIKRWAFYDKGFQIRNISDDKTRAWAEKIDKQDQSKISKENLMKFESVFLGMGAEILSFMKSVLTVNPEDAKQDLVGKLQKAIDSIRATGDAANIAKLELELQRLEDLGGFDKIVPTEGIVFSYKGNVIKLTGAFAPLNQILGIFTYSR